MILADKIIDLRKKNGWSQEELAEKLGVSRQADWLVGINATRALTCKHNAQLSCGRVQTPTPRQNN